MMVPETSQNDSFNTHDKVYFERQGNFSLQCGRHAMNNLFGREVYTKTRLNSICYRLSDALINPHKHIFGGEYDVNVMMMALQEEGYDTQWIDSRKLFSWTTVTKDKAPLGLLICHREQSTCAKKLCGIEPRHWVCIRLLDENFLLIDSKNDRPNYLHNVQAMERYVHDKLKASSEILLVFRKVELLPLTISTG